MTTHPALKPGSVAVVTGAASGIGLAAARRFAALGMRVCLVDINEEKLRESVIAVALAAPNGAVDVMAMGANVSDAAAMRTLAGQVANSFGQVSVVMANAGMEPASSALDASPQWQRIIDTNLWGVINTVQAFARTMVDSGAPGAVIVTGSKQGITCPPGNAAYNVSKAGVKVFTEQVAHALREETGERITAHLLIPGFTFTGFTLANYDEKPDAAWMPDQVIDMLMEAMDAGEFYILCPDNDVTRAMDEKRIQWAADDIIKNRPALSRWHKDYAEPFAAWMKAKPSRSR
ncbi:MAG: SDR family oxidoreductase [Rhodobiaceae bacterium]|nr:SDR family oxidoreductase [Rhodobiaceae bacterium]